MCARPHTSQKASCYNTSGDLPYKKLNVSEGSFFDIFPINIINLINNWIIRSEKLYTHKKIISQFTCQPFPIILTLAQKHRKPRHNCGSLQYYGTTRYKWAHSIDITCLLRLYMKQILTKNRHE